MYRIQAETQHPHQDVGEARDGYQGRGRCRGGGGPGRGHGQVICYNCRTLGHYVHECTSQT